MMAGSKSALEELKWIEDEASPYRPPIDEFPLIGQRTVGNTILKKMSENMLVPIGLAATVACLTMGLISMNRGDSRKQQIFMRGRVGFQCLTFIAMASTIALTARKRERK